MNHRTVLVTVALLFAAACESRQWQRMVSPPPPEDWESRLAERRRQRDDYFRHSPETPLLADAVEGFAGLDYWSADPDFYFVGPLNEYREKQPFEIVTTSGKKRDCEKFGWVEFVIDGQAQRLQVYRLLDIPGGGDAGFLLPFADETTGDETYPAGRYVDLEGAAGGPYVLDFNTAYNPSCAYGAPERYACPVTPAENRLRVPVAVGERGFELLPEAAE